MAEGRKDAPSSVQIQFMWERPPFLSLLRHCPFHICIGGHAVNGDSSRYSHHPLLHAQSWPVTFGLFINSGNKRVRKIRRGNRVWTPPLGQDKDKDRGGDNEMQVQTIRGVTKDRTIQDNPGQARPKETRTGTDPTRRSWKRA